MEKKLRKLIEYVILPKYSKIISLDDIEDFGKRLKLNHLSDNYNISFTTSECLNELEMIEIDSEVKKLFKMIYPVEINDFSPPNVRCFFNCNDGNGHVFKAPYGYKNSI